MHLLSPLGRFLVVLILASTVFSTSSEAAPIPDAASTDSTVVAGKTGSVQGIDSDTHLVLMMLPFVQQYLFNQTFRIIAHATNIRTTSGGPYTVGDVIVRVFASYHLLFLRCISENFVCETEPDPETGGTIITGTLGTLEAGDTKTLEIEVQAVEAGSGSITGVMEQEDFDPDPTNNTVNLTFNVSEPQNGAVFGYKFEDMNGNGQWESEEPGLNDWTIRLLQENTERTTQTNDMPEYGDGVTTPLETGWYEFADVAPGEYQVHEVVPDGWVQSAPEEVYYDIQVNPDEMVGPLDFGNYRPGSIMGTVYGDHDANGTFSVDDEGLEGLTVSLNGTDGRGQPVSRTTTTFLTGIYIFSNLSPGTYTVTATAPAALPTPTETPAQIALSSGMAVEAANIGFAAAPAPRLEVTIEPDNVSTLVGALIPFTVTATNTGNATATDVEIGINWPLFGLYARDFTELPPNCEENALIVSSTIMCRVGDLAPSASENLTFSLRVLSESKLDSTTVNRPIAGRTRASNHPLESDYASVLAGKLDIDLGAFKVKSGGGRKTAQGEVDVYLDSLLVISSIGEGTATAFADVSLTHTKPMLHLLPTGVTDLNQAILAKEMTFGEGKGDSYSLPTSYFLVLSDNDATLVRDALQTTANSQKVSFALVHAAPTIGDVDLTNAELGTAPVAVGSATGYGEVAAAEQVLNVVTPGTQDVLASFRFDWSDDGGKAFVLVLMDGPVLEAVGADGAVVSSVNATAAEAEELPERLELYANYPNPFNPVTTLSYALPVSGEVRLEVYDALGRKVAVLAEGIQEAGRHEVSFSADGLPSGLYVYRLSAGERVQARTMVVLK